LLCINGSKISKHIQTQQKVTVKILQGSTATQTVLGWLYIHRGPQKRCHFYFYDNFGKCGPMWISI